MVDKSKQYMNPYLAGTLLGFVIMAAFYFSGEGLGGSGVFKDLIATAVTKVSPEYSEGSNFFSKYLDREHLPIKSWLAFEVLGVLIGGVISGAFAGRLKLKVEHSPKITSKTRIIMAIIGGILFGIGSQLGRGCTSGAALSGMAVLSVSGFLSAAAIFGSGYLFAWIFKRFWV